LVLLQLTRLLPDAVGTTCGERLERVYDSEYCDILRVPFRTEKGIVRKWISRFEVWPYLETYTEVKYTHPLPLKPCSVRHFRQTEPFLLFQDAAVELSKELNGKPDLIIGNYSDGNLVASLLAHKLGVTQVWLLETLIFSISPMRYVKRQANALRIISYSVPLLMLLRKQSTRILISTGRSLTTSTISHASSLRIFSQ